MRMLLRACALLAGLTVVFADPPNNLPRDVEDKIIKNANFASQELQNLENHKDDLGDFEGVIARETANLAAALDAVAGDIDTLIPLISQTQDPLLQQKLQQMNRAQAALVAAVAADNNLLAELGQALAALASACASMEEFRECMLTLLNPNRKPANNNNINVSAPGAGKPPADFPDTTSTDPATRIDQNVELLDAAGDAVDAKAKWVDQFANEFPDLVSDIGAIQNAVTAELAALAGATDPALVKKRECLEELVTPFADAATAAMEVSTAETDDQEALDSAHDELHGAESVMEDLSDQAHNR